MSRYRFFRRLGNSSRCYRYPPPVLSITESLEYGFAEMLQRVAFTIIGAIMIWWSWMLLEPQIPKFPNLDWLVIIVAIFTLLLGIRNVLSLFKDVTWGQAFLTLLFVAVNAYLIWFV